MDLVGDKVERCPKLKVIDVSGTLAEVSSVLPSRKQCECSPLCRLFVELTTASLCRTYSTTLLFDVV